MGPRFARGPIAYLIQWVTIVGRGRPLPLSHSHPNLRVGGGTCTHSSASQAAATTRCTLHDQPYPPILHALYGDLQHDALLQGAVGGARVVSAFVHREVIPRLLAAEQRLQVALQQPNCCMVYLCHHWAMSFTRLGRCSHSWMIYVRNEYPWTSWSCLIPRDFPSTTVSQWLRRLCFDLTFF